MKNIVNKIRLNYQKIMVVFLLLIGIGGFTFYGWQQAPDATLVYGQSPLRLHILANSDSVEDQKTKLIIRDAIIGLMEEKLAEAKNKEEAIYLLEQALPELTAATNAYLADIADYEASLSIAKSDFPDIDYGEISLAAGEYDALKISLGEGSGKNWWCVLFPPLCFVDLAAESQPVATTITGNHSQSDTVEVRLKLWDILDK